MTDWDQLREIGEQASPPPFDALVEEARHRDRRRRVVTGAVTLLVVTAVAAGTWLSNGSDDGAIQPVKPPSDGSTSDRVSLPGGVLRLPEPDPAGEAVVTEGGRYRVELDDQLSFDVDLPPQTTVNNGGLYLIHDGVVLKVEIADETYGVPSDPCRLPGYIVPAGPTVEELVDAVRGESTYRVLDRAPAEIDGAAGQYFEMRLPPGFDASRCESNQLGLPGRPDSVNNMPPGYVGRWWILDVDGHRTAIQVFAERRDAKGFERMTELAEGITFTPTG